MLDIIGSIVLTAYCAIAVGLVVGFAQVASDLKFKLLMGVAAWIGLVVAVYASGGLPPGFLGPIPANLLPFGIVLAALFGTWLLSPAARRALESVPLAALVATHAGRLAGVFFLLLYLVGRLSAPFGPVAAFGDMATGALAVLLAGIMVSGTRVRNWWVTSWNAFGALDLLVAVALAVLSAPGTPFRLFHDPAGTKVLATLPWIFAPAILVPMDLFLHFLIARRLRSSGASVGLVRAQPSFSRV